VSAEFEVDEDRARADVAAYLSDLREVGLVLLDSAS